MFLDLLPEIQEQILTYCTIRALKNLSLTCFECNDIVQPLLYHTVRISSSFVLQKVFDERLHYLKSTKVLRILDCYLPEHELETMSKLNKLHELNLDRCNINDNNLREICKGLSQLKTLNIGRTKVTDTGMVYLRQLSALEELVLYQSAITFVGLSHLSTLPRLTRLDVSYSTNISDNTLACISSLTKLEELAIQGCEKIDGDGLSYLSALPALKMLDISDNKRISNTKLVHLSSLNVLEELVLRNNTQIDDEGFSYVAIVRTLRRLNTSGCSIRDEFFSFLMLNLPELQELTIKDCEYLSRQGVLYYKENAPFIIRTNRPALHEAVLPFTVCSRRAPRVFYPHLILNRPSLSH